MEDSFQEALEEYNRNFERLSDVLGDHSLTESGAKKAVQIEETKNVLANALPIAVKSMTYLAAHADSESVMYNASKFLIELQLGKEPAFQATDPTKDLIARLTGGTEDGS